MCVRSSRKVQTDAVDRIGCASYPQHITMRLHPPRLAWCTASAQADGVTVTVAPRSPAAVLVHAPNVVVGNEESIDVDAALERMDQSARIRGTAERGWASESAGPLLGVVSTAPAVLCLCNMPAKLGLVKSQSPNFGRQFWTCNLPIGHAERCDFFEWLTAASLPAATTTEPICAACTFRNQPGKRACKMCRTPLKSPSPEPLPSPTSAPDKQQMTPALPDPATTSTSEGEGLGVGPARGVGTARRWTPAMSAGVDVEVDAVVELAPSRDNHDRQADEVGAAGSESERKPEPLVWF